MAYRALAYIAMAFIVMAWRYVNHNHIILAYVAMATHLAAELSGAITTWDHNSIGP